MNDLIAIFKEKCSFFYLQNKRLVHAGLACVSGLLVLALYFQTAPKPEAYIAAEEIVSKWKQEGSEVSYDEMRKTLRKVPALEKKYASLIAQKLFQRNQLKDALELAHKSIEQIQEDAPFHAAYGKTTLLIEQGMYQDALEKSVALKEQMLRECDLELQAGRQPMGGSLLFTHNLLRIACLQKELKNKPGEKAAWDELERFLTEKQSLSQLLFTNFRDKGLDLSHYIAERKKQLS
jgi:hypothetical protein